MTQEIVIVARDVVCFSIDFTLGPRSWCRNAAKATATLPVPKPILSHLGVLDRAKIARSRERDE